MIPLLLHQSYTYGAFSISLLTNATFIWISTTTLTDQIGRYRYLMIGFSIMDFMVALVHLVLMPGVQLTPDGYIFFGYHMVNQPPFMGVIACTCFLIFLHQTFIILALQYIYRYAVVCEPRWRKVFLGNETIWWGFIAMSVQMLYNFAYYEFVQIGCLPTEDKSFHFHDIFINNTGIDNAQFDFGYLGIVFRKPSNSTEYEWQGDAVFTMVGALTLFFLTVLVIVACSALILRQLRIVQSGITNSAQMRATQHQLLKALIIQTAIPILFSYTPLGMIFLTTFLGFNLNGIYGDLMIMSTAVFPALDSVVMLFFVRSYRTRVITIWKNLTRQNTIAVEDITQFTPSSAPSEATTIKEA